MPAHTLTGKQTTNHRIENVPEARKTGILPTHRKTRLPLKKNPDAGADMTLAQEAARRFFESPKFAVAGASAETHKFGYKCKTRLVLPVTLSSGSYLRAKLV